MFPESALWAWNGGSGSIQRCEPSSLTAGEHTPSVACVNRLESSAAASGIVALLSMSRKNRTAEIFGVRYLDHKPITAPPTSVIVAFLSLLLCTVQRSTPVVGVQGTRAGVSFEPAELHNTMLKHKK
jgi:hypothetical protein